jgi:hypothetical protein
MSLRLLLVNRVLRSDLANDQKKPLLNVSTQSWLVHSHIILTCSTHANQYGYLQTKQHFLQHLFPKCLQDRIRLPLFDSRPDCLQRTLPPRLLQPLCL